MKGMSRWITALTSVLLLIFSSIFGTPQADASGYQLHEPIAIVGNEAFTPENGVVAGNGTADDPYVIAGWEIHESTATGIYISDTDAHFVIRDVYIHSTNGVLLSNVTNGHLRFLLLEDLCVGISIAFGSAGISVSESVIRHYGSAGIWFLNGSATVRGNTIHGSATPIDISQSSDAVILDNSLNYDPDAPGPDCDFVHISEETGDALTTSDRRGGSNVVLALSTNFTLRNNSMLNGGVRIAGSSIEHFDTHAITSDNLVNGRPLAYHARCSSLTVDGEELGQLLLANCTDVRVVNVQLANPDTGILAAYLNSARFTNVTVTGASVAGIEVYRSSNLTVEGSTLTQSNQGLRLWRSVSMAIRDNRIQDNGIGLDVRDALASEIVGNEVRENGIGLQLGFSSALSVARNRLVANGQGLVLMASENISVRFNAFRGDGLTFFLRPGIGLRLPYFNTHTITPDNLVNGRPIWYHADCAGLTLAGDVAGQVLLANCTDVQVRDMALPDVEVGVQAVYSKNVQMTNLTVRNATRGVQVYRSENVSLEASTFTDASLTGVSAYETGALRLSLNRFERAGEAISLYLVEDFDLWGNRATDGSRGVSLFLVWDGIVRDNRWINNAFGAWVAGAINVTFDGNEALSGGAGMAITSSEELVLRRNRIASNAFGMQLLDDRGVLLYHNHFVDNDFQVEDDGGSENRWDGGYPRGGNYWSDHSQEDECGGAGQDDCSGGDDLVDHPYQIDSDSVDRYPLVLTPPVPAIRVNPGAGDVNTVFAFDASGSSSPADPTEGLEYRWDWDGDGRWDTPWQLDGVAQHRYDAPGHYTARVEVRNVKGFTNATEEQVAVGPDILAPAIAHAPAPTVPVGQEIQVVANVTDGASLREVVLHYRVEGEAKFTQVQMSQREDGLYVGVIPARSSPGAVHYWIEATDAWGNTNRSPASGEHRVWVTGPLGTVAVLLLVGVALGLTLGLAALSVRLRRRTPPTEKTGPGAS